MEWYRRSLAIYEELSDQAGVASSYHQLGAVAHQRRDYDSAEEWYRRSLAILCGARGPGQHGHDHQRDRHPDDRDRPGRGGSSPIMSMRREMRLPEAGIDVLWLRRQRTLLGESRFRALVRDRLDPEGTNRLMQLFAC